MAAGWTRCGAGPPGAGAAGGRGDDRGRGQRPGGRQAVPGVADEREPVAAGAGRRAAGRRWPPRGRAARSASSPRPSWPSWRRCWMPGPAACGYEDQCWTLARVADQVWRAVRGGVHAGRDGCAAAPARVERAGPGAPGGRAGRGQDRRVAGGDLAGGKRTAADLGAWLCFEDESGQGLRPPKGRTWGRRGQHPGGDGDRRPRHAGVAGRADRHPARPPGPADLPDAPRAAGEISARGSPRRTTPGSWTPRTSSSAARSWWCGTA